MFALNLTICLQPYYTLYVLTVYIWTYNSDSSAAKMKTPLYCAADNELPAADI
jgi:hypothetical protein